MKRPTYTHTHIWRVCMGRANFVVERYYSRISAFNMANNFFVSAEVVYMRDLQSYCLLPIHRHINIYRNTLYEWWWWLLLLFVVFQSSRFLVTSLFDGFHSVRHLFFPHSLSQCFETKNKSWAAFFIIIVLSQMQNQDECHFQLLSSKDKVLCRRIIYTRDEPRPTELCDLIHIRRYKRWFHGNKRREWNEVKAANIDE